MKKVFCMFLLVLLTSVHETGYSSNPNGFYLSAYFTNTSPQYAAEIACASYCCSSGAYLSCTVWKNAFGGWGDMLGGGWPPCSWVVSNGQCLYSDYFH